MGGNRGAVKGIIRRVLEAEERARREGGPRGVDGDFSTRHTTGFAAFAADVADEAWETIDAESGLAQEQLRRAGDIYMAAGSVICCWGMGITQHKHSVATIKILVTLLLLRGNPGRPAAGARPVGGHSHVPGRGEEGR